MLLINNFSTASVRQKIHPSVTTLFSRVKRTQQREPNHIFKCYTACTLNPLQSFLPRLTKTLPASNPAESTPPPAPKRKHADAFVEIRCSPPLSGLTNRSLYFSFSNLSSFGEEGGGEGGKHTFQVLATDFSADIASDVLQHLLFREVKKKLHFSGEGRKNLETIAPSSRPVNPQPKSTEQQQQPNPLTPRPRELALNLSLRTTTALAQAAVP